MPTDDPIPPRCTFCGKTENNNVTLVVPYQNKAPLKGICTECLGIVQTVLRYGTSEARVPPAPTAKPFTNPAYPAYDAVRVTLQPGQELRFVIGAAGEPTAIGHRITQNYVRDKYGRLRCSECNYMADHGLDCTLGKAEAEQIVRAAAENLHEETDD